MVGIPSPTAEIGCSLETLDEPNPRPEIMEFERFGKLVCGSPMEHVLRFLTY